MILEDACYCGSTDEFVDSWQVPADQGGGQAGSCGQFQGARLPLQLSLRVPGIDLGTPDSQTFQGSSRISGIDLTTSDVRGGG